jgi:tetratricopeptide (TPR) repeat protein
VVELRALDPAKDHYLFTLREQAADQAALLPLVDRLSEAVRLRLREGEQEVRSSDIQVASAVTPNLEAYRHYFLGQQFVAQADMEAALGEFRAAVKGDPGFTAARLRLWHTGLYVGDEEFELAGDLLGAADALPAKERALATALGALHTGELARARAAAAPLAARFPEDRDTLIIAGDVLGATGDLAGAELAFRALLALDRRNALALGNLVVTLFDAGRPAEALAVTGDLAEPPPGWALLVASWSAGYVGDVDRAERLGRAAIEAGNKFDAFMMLSMAADARGDRAGLQQALEETGRRAEGAVIKVWQRLSVMAALGRWREAVPQGEPPPPIGRVGWITARVLMGIGRTEEARRLVRGLPAVEGWSLLVLLARLGDAERVAAITAELPADGYPHRLGESLLAWLRGDRETALAALRALDTGSRSQVAWLRGTVAAELGKDEEAVDALGRYDRLMRGGGEELERIDMLPRGRITRARSLDRLGRRAEAREVVRRQLDVWRDADADLPLLAEAKALCGKLGCKAPD